MTTALELQNQIETKNTQAATLRAQRSELEKHLAAARGDLGRAVADGKSEADQSKLRARSREYSEAIEGIAAAIPMIENEISEQSDQIKKLAVSEAITARADAERDFEAARIKAGEAFFAFWAEYSANEVKAFTEAVNRYHRAVADEDLATGRKTWVLATERPGQGSHIHAVLLAVGNVMNPTGGYGTHDPQSEAGEPTGTWRDLARASIS
jgi:seryl-tRNA synthetase